MKNGTDKTASETKELLLEDYRYLSESFWKNEQTGETRVNFFIGIVTAVLGALGVTIISEKITLAVSVQRLVIAISLFALLLLGLITMLRLLTRNRTTDGYKHGLDAIRQIFKDHFDRGGVLIDYYPTGRFVNKTENNGNRNDAEKKPANNQTEKGCWARLLGYVTNLVMRSEDKTELRKFGGLAHTVAAINSVLLALAIGSLLYPMPITNEWGEVGATADLECVYALLSMAAVFVLGLTVQLGYIVCSELRSTQIIDSSGYTHAGGAVYRLKNGVVLYLLVRPKNKKKQMENEWVLPKGHIRKGEGHGEAALREVREETGVVARLMCVVAERIAYKQENEQVNAKFYLMEYLYGVQPDEERTHKWVPLPREIRDLKYEESRFILKQAEITRINRN